MGAHVSAAGGVFHAPENANEIGAKAFGLFVKNQKQWNAPPLLEEEAIAFQEKCEQFGYHTNQILPHASYLINPANPDRQKRKRSIDGLVLEMKRCEKLGLNRLNLHPGSHLGGASLHEAFDFVAKTLDEALKQVDNVSLVLENTAGQGHGIGHDFAHIGEILDRMQFNHRAGFTLDTCHAFSAGYDLVSEEGYESTMKELEKKIGFEKLMGVHLNDSKTPMGSRKDRHESISQGTLGIVPFRRIMNDPRFNEIPMILETIDPAIWDQEIQMLYSLEGQAM